MALREEWHACAKVKDNHRIISAWSILYVILGWRILQLVRGKGWVQSGG